MTAYTDDADDAPTGALTLDDAAILRPDAPVADRPAGPGRAVRSGLQRDRRSGIGVLVVAALAGVLGVICTIRLWQHPGSTMVTGNLPDAIHYTWWLAHTPYAITHGQNPFLTTAMNWPTGVGTMNNTTLVLPSLLLSPITWTFSSLATLNLLNIVAVPACIGAGYWALRQPDVLPPLSRPVALAGGVVFGISPAIVNSLVGHVTMAFAPALPILIVLGTRAWRSDRPVRAGVWLGVLAAVQVFIGEEVLFQAVMGALIVLVVCALARPRQVRGHLLGALQAYAVAAGIVLVVSGYALYQQFFGPLKQHGSPFLENYYGADLTSFWTTSARLILHTTAGTEATSAFPGGVEEHLGYLGVPLLLLCLVVGVIGWRRLPVRCAFVGLIISMLLELGGRVWVHGRQHSLRGPYALLQSLPVTESSLATRLALLAAVFAGALLAFGLQALLEQAPVAPRVRGLVAGLVALVCLAPLVPRVLPVEPAPVVPSYFTTTATALPSGSVVVVLPYPNGVNPVAMRWQVASGFAFSMPGGYFLGPGGPDAHAYVGGDADPEFAQILSQVADTGRAVADSPELRQVASRDLASWHPAAIVLGPAGHIPATSIEGAADSVAGTTALRTTLTALLGPPAQTGGVLVWSDPVHLLSQT